MHHPFLGHHSGDNYFREAQRLQLNCAIAVLFSSLIKTFQWHSAESKLFSAVEEGEEMLSLGQWLYSTHFLDAYYLMYRQAKNLTQNHLPSVQTFPFKKSVKKKNKKTPRLHTWHLDYFAVRVKILFFLIVTNAAALQEFSVLVILLSKISGKIQHRKNCKDLYWNSYTQTRIYFLAVTHALFPNMFLCFTFAQTS